MKKLIEAIRVRAGLDDDSEAERALWATVFAVAPSVQPCDRQTMLDAWPEQVHETVASIRYVGPLEESTFYENVAHRLGDPVGHAREVSQVVLRSLAERLGPERRARLARHAHPSMAWLWNPPPAPESPGPHPRLARRPGSGHTLASGRPGSRHPLSEAGPLGHADSIAVTPEPYADRKLSSARGTTAEQRRRTLAEGHPGSEHPLSEPQD